jgi:parallel beta-helix repeat protein
MIDNWISGSNGISLWPDSHNNTITKNILCNLGSGIYIGSNSNDNTAIDNLIYENGYGIRIYSSFNNLITQNNISNNDNEGIFIEYADNNIVTDNIITLNLNYGLYFEYSDINMIFYNNVSSNSEGGIYLDHSNENEIFNNNITDGKYGFYLDYSDENEIFKNNITYHSLYGIWTGDSDRNNLANNYFSYNGRGIETHSSIMNIIRGNIFIKNDYGIVTSSWSLWNTIYHNCFFESNMYHAYDFSNDDNYWDNGYPSGGNYWSDFDEPGEGAYDNYQGVDQDILGNDGIIDNGTIGGSGLNPYVISGDEYDYYPLVSLSGNLSFLFNGWNLISIPLLQTDTNLSTVLSPIAGSYDAVQWYDLNDLNDPWKHNHMNKSSELNDLRSINTSMGFFIHITDSPGVLFEFPGSPLTDNQFIDLDVGWNLVGYPSFNKYNLINGLNNLEFGVDVDCVQWYDAAAQTWHFMGPTDHFIPGRGYWIHSKVETSWEVPL